MFWEHYRVSLHLKLLMTAGNLQKVFLSIFPAQSAEKFWGVLKATLTSEVKEICIHASYKTLIKGRADSLIHKKTTTNKKGILQIFLDRTIPSKLTKIRARFGSQIQKHIFFLLVVKIYSNWPWKFRKSNNWHVSCSAGK